MADWREDSWDFLSGDLDRDRRNLHVLMDTAEELYSVVDPDERMCRAVDRAVLVTGAEKGILLTPRGGQLEPRVVRGLRGEELALKTQFSRSSVQDVWESGKPIKEQGTALLVRPSHSVLDQRILSIMATRLLFEGRPVGVLYVHGTFETVDFTDADFQAFIALGGLIATAMVNAELSDESRDRERLDGQVKLAREVQRRLQPQGDFAPVGLEFAGVGRVCQELSGDYHDYLQRPDGRIAIAIGDVCGHGIRAALYGTTARALFRGLMEQDADPAEALGTMNRFLARDMDPAEYMTFFLGVVDPQARTLMWCSAGHNEPLLRLANGETQELKGTGPMLGFEPDTRYGVGGPVPFEAGSLLLLYTDGVTEAPNAAGDRWETERLIEALVRHGTPDRSARGVLSSILEEVDAFRKPGPLEDDITCLVVRSA